MRTRFNLATSPIENNRRFIAGSAVLGIVALAALALLSLHVVRARRANQTMRNDIDRLQSRIRVLESQQAALRGAFQSPQAIEAMKRSEFLNGLIEQRTFPWIKMFADLGQVLPPGVRVISIAPRMDQNGKVRVTLAIGAVNSDQENKFLQLMDSSPAFSDVVVTRESRPAQQSNGNSDRVMLNLEVRYSTT